MKSFAGAYVNLLKTSIGSGVLSFPYLFKTYGIVLSVVLTLLTGMLATTGLVLLTICSQTIGRTADLSKLATQCFPYARIFVDLAVFLKCFGVSLSYVIITRQLLPSILQSVFSATPSVRPGFLASPPATLFIFLGLIGPFSYLTRLDRLKYTSFVGVFSIVLVIIAAIARLSTTDTTDIKTHLFVPMTSDWLVGLGKFVFSFTCHQNIFAVNAEIEDNSLANMKRLICTVSLSSFTLYMTFGMTNYMLYGSAVGDNVLSSYPSDSLAICVRALYVVVMGVSYPLQMAPARAYLMSMIGISTEMKKYRVVHFLVTTFLIVMTYLIAVMGMRLGIVYSIVGATASCFMCLILPALFYFNLEVEKTLLLSVAAYCSFLLGIFIFSTTVFGVVYREISLVKPVGQMIH